MRNTSLVLGLTILAFLIPSHQALAGKVIYIDSLMETSQAESLVSLSPAQVLNWFFSLLGVSS